MLNKNIVYLEMESALLKSNPMGNATLRGLVVLLPQGYSEQKRYPTVWMLGGYLDNAFTMVADGGPLGKSLPQRMLDWQKRGQLRECLVVFPDLSTKLGGSQFVNSAAGGPFMDCLTDEMLPFIEKQFSCIAEPAGRVLAGHSSGGYGSLVIAMLRPNIFGAVIASAADSGFENSLRPSFANAAIAYKKSGGPLRFWEGLQAKNYPEKLSPCEFDALMTLAMASCFSPLTSTEALADPANAPHFALLPFDAETLEPVSDVWELWNNWDPIELLKTHGNKLKKLWHLHLDVGDADECAAQFGHRRMHKILKSLGVNHLYSEFSGTHSGCSYRWGERFALLQWPK